MRGNITYIIGSYPIKKKDKAGRGAMVVRGWGRRPSPRSNFYITMSDQHPGLTLFTGMPEFEAQTG